MNSNIVEIILFLISGLLSIPMLVVSVECLMSFFVLRKEDDLSSIKRPQIGVIIPAHNEERLLYDTITSIKRYLVEGDRILVVADNCVDETARIALCCGVELVERIDAHDKGKGYALDAGIRAYKKNPPEVIIIFDADCRLAKGNLETLAKKSMTSQRPVQAIYLMQNEGLSSSYEVFGQFAWIVKNWVRPLGLKRLNLPCMLTGSGMAFPWAIAKNANLASPHIAEDMKLGLDLILDKMLPCFCPEVLVTSAFPANPSGRKAQRRRWEHGFLDLAFHYIPTLWVNALKQRRIGLLLISFDLIVPPLALLCLFLLLGLVVELVGFIYDYKLPFFMLLSSSGVFVATILLVRYKFAKDVISMYALLKFPLYIFMKVPLYLDFIFDRETKWHDPEDGD